MAFDVFELPRNWLTSVGCSTAPSIRQMSEPSSLMNGTGQLGSFLKVDQAAVGGGGEIRLEVSELRSSGGLP